MLLVPLIWTVLVTVGLFVSILSMRDAQRRVRWLLNQADYLTLVYVARTHVRREFYRALAQAINLLLGLLSLWSLANFPRDPRPRQVLAVAAPIGLIAVALILAYSSLVDYQLRRRTIPTSKAEGRSGAEAERRVRSGLIEAAHQVAEVLRRKQQKAADQREAKEDKL